jgi:hypothetical protein
MEDYLTTAEAARLLRYAAKTLRNKIAAGIFREGVHFVQNRGSQKRWKRSALVAWLEGSETAEAADEIPLAGQAVGRSGGWAYASK